MDGFETPYDDDAEFIECTVCEKSIRGETLFKIHVTSPGHLKKEDALVAAGQLVQRQHVPVFEDILHYLDYMKLDEPIIGLDYLNEMPNSGPKGDPSYICSLCNQTAHLTEMVRHLIGRKHRQKYLETKRPDLVTWDKQAIKSLGGKLFRAKAEIVERLDGRGHPLLIKNKWKNSRHNTARGYQRQNRNRKDSQSFTPRDVTSHLPKLMDCKIECPPRLRYPPEHTSTPPFHSEDAYTLNQDGMDSPRLDRVEEGLWMEDYRGEDGRRREYVDPDYRRDYKEGHFTDEQGTAMMEPHVSKYDTRSDMPYDQRKYEEYYREESSYGRCYPEINSPDDFNSEKIRSIGVRSPEYEPLQPVHPEGDNHQWSLDRESGRYDSMNRTSGQGSRELEARRRSFPTMVESDRPCDLLFNPRDYSDKIRDPQYEEAKPGSSRTGPPNFERQEEVPRFMSDIPEPFRRFLEGDSNNSEHGKRKRKSRFSDATAEEMARTKGMLDEEYGPSKLKFGNYPRPGGPPLSPEIQHPGLYTESQDPHQNEIYQRGGGSESEGVFDMLKNIEIENIEEADFLKNKLCDLLKEFKAKKSDKAEQKYLGRAFMSKDFSTLNPDAEQVHKRQYDGMLREDSDFRRQVDDPNFQEDHRGRVWKQNEYLVEEQLQEYHHFARGEPRYTDLKRSQEDAFGRPEISLRPHTTHSNDAAYYNERFRESLRPHDYPPVGEEYLDSCSGARYSNNLDKITSTLLELVKRQ